MTCRSSWTSQHSAAVTTLLSRESKSGCKCEQTRVECSQPCKQRRRMHISGQAACKAHDTTRVFLEIWYRNVLQSYELWVHHYDRSSTLMTSGQCRSWILSCCLVNASQQLLSVSWAVSSHLRYSMCQSPPLTCNLPILCSYGVIPAIREGGKGSLSARVENAFSSTFLHVASPRSGAMLLSSTVVLARMEGSSSCCGSGRRKHSGGRLRNKPFDLQRL